MRSVLIGLKTWRALPRETCLERTLRRLPSPIAAGAAHRHLRRSDRVGGLLSVAGRSWGYQFRRMTSRRTWRRADVVTHLPLTMCIPAPHAWRTGAIMSSGWGSGASDMACAGVATAKAKTTAINLIISVLLCEISRIAFLKHAHLVRRLAFGERLESQNERFNRPLL
jgi:hypothetical protein